MRGLFINMKVSIITPSYNQGKFIARTINSVISQRDDLPENYELEYVIFDGGSNDETISILNSYTKPFSKLDKNAGEFKLGENLAEVLRWVSEKDNGQSHAVNKGLMSTSGEIIGWLNSDDIYYPRTIAKVVAFFADNPEIDVLYGQAHHIDINDAIIEKYPSQPWDFKRLQNTCFICQPAVFFRRGIIEKVGFVREELNYCMDYDLWVRMANCGARFAYFKEVLAGSRLYDENKTLSARVAVHKEINDMLRDNLGFVPTRALINYAYAVVSDSLDKSAHPLKFAFSVLRESFVAARGWNGSIGKFCWQAGMHWLKSLMLGRFLLWWKKS